MSYLWLPMGDTWVREVSYNYSSNKFVRHVRGWITLTPRRHLWGVGEKIKSVA